MLISALGIHLHQFWGLLLGSGVIGGIGLPLAWGVYKTLQSVSKVFQ